MEKKEGYKKTAIGWIPEGWDIEKLGGICEVKGGKRIPKGSSLLDEDTGFPYIRVADMFMGGIKTNALKYVPDDVVSIIERYTISKDDLFISVAGTLGIVGQVPDILDGANLTENADKLTNISCDKNYLLHILQSQIIQGVIQRDATLNALPKLAIQRIKKFIIPTPPLPEQTKIADILTTVDDKISSIDSQIQQTEQLKKGLMEKLLSEGIGHTEFKETEIGRVPVGWDVITIGQIVKKIVGGGTPSRERFDYYNGDIPWITVKDLATNSYYKNSAIEHISEEGLRNSASNLIHRKNIIIATRMGLGRGFINTIDMAINQDMKALYLDREKISNRFFLFWYLSKSSFIETLGTGTTVKGISLPTLKKLALPFPPLPEQKQIATILSTVDDKLNILTQKKSHFQTLKKELSQQLLIGQMRVKV